MTDALRSDRPGDAPDRERDARIEELLLSGLDHYFTGQHELAINVWTRVLFLDRNHATARAYIERARSALSERQREGDELLHAGAAALGRGDRLAARQLLTSAIERGANGEDALALLHRLDRLEAAVSPIGGAAAPASPAAKRRSAKEVEAGRRDSRIAWVAAGVVAGVLIAALVGTYLWLAADPLDLTAAQVTSPQVAEDPLPVPAACEIRLLRARALYAKGRLREAAALLEAGDPDERHRASMDELRGTIQRQLLAAARQPDRPARESTTGPSGPSTPADK
jgi:hypothetical protein